jgi:hypothetical protein
MAEQQPQPTTITPPVGVPQSYPFVGSIIYVRECYDKYYKMILKLLETKQFISVTGTPGIGKSAFYLYFFKRYRQEHQDDTVLTASFSESQDLEDCLLWKADGAKQAYESVVPREAANIYLYDGPPKTKPAGTTKMIAFTCPNRKWLTSQDKNAFHVRVYMPNWDFAEMMKARDLLAIDLLDDILEKRFSLFGGAVRYCFSLDEGFILSGATAITVALTKLTSFDSLKNCFDGSEDLKVVVHRLMHYVLAPDCDARSANLEPASVEISKLMNAALEKLCEHERGKLMRWLDGAGKASTFFGWLFENHVHARLLKGETFKIRSLGGNVEESQLSISPTVGKYERFKKVFTAAQIFREIYQIPSSDTQESIDSYILTATELWMFQITRNMCHPVGAEGIVALLEQLGILADVKSGAITVKLFFVVPSEMSERYAGQEISHKSAFSQSVEELRGCDCDKVPGIKAKKKRKLDEINIRTVGELVDAVASSNPLVSFVASPVKNMIKTMAMMADIRFLEQIGQFVIGVDYSEANC